MESKTLVAQNWKLDLNHTDINFKVGHLGIAFISGNFSEFEGKLELVEESSFENARVSFSLSTDSLNTGNDMRDNHLKTPEFFDAFSYPSITFESTAFYKTEGDTYKLIGNLTIRDQCREIELTALYKGGATDLWGNNIVVFHIKGEIDRLDFGIEWNQKLESGIPVVGKTVEFDMNIELVPDQE
ncbi:YceI family protein [Flexithrix dorotheae]|uniref:YceI family protein n=1 Tax=Flexithrix dorotheae TaxID=70993 RepID=UPI000369F526|nr:YceI family protein [Flexithrix dorotheae]